jgi:hypothetical protein
MPNAFLLRYQEFCVEYISARGHCGTKTDARVHGEQSDNNPVAVPSALPSVSRAGGTMTKTSIDRETGGQDQDRWEGRMRAIHRWEGRMRAIPGSDASMKGKQEQPDPPHCEAASGDVASLLMLPVAQTKTITAVHAEADDKDPKRADLHVIPRCS